MVQFEMPLEMDLLFFILDSTPPMKLRVMLAGNTDEYHNSKNGVYVLDESKQVNNYPYWLKTNQVDAIWWDKKNSDWKIGPKSHLGTDCCYIYAPSGDERNPNLIQSGWKYCDKNSKWQDAGPNEVIIKDCSDEAPDQSYCLQDFFQIFNHYGT